MHKSFEDLDAALKDATQKIEVGGLYRHYKDPASRYKVLGLVILEADDTVAVRYASLLSQEVEFVRPITSWLDEIDGIPRFAQITDSSTIP